MAATLDLRNNITYSILLSFSDIHQVSLRCWPWQRYAFYRVSVLVLLTTDVDTNNGGLTVGTQLT